MRTAILAVGAWAILAASLCAGDKEPVAAELSHAQQIEAFLKEYPKAVPLIVIKNGKGDFSNWKKFEAEVIDGDHVQAPKTNPGTKLKGRLRLGGHAYGVYYRNMYVADLTPEEKTLTVQSTK